MPQKTNKTAHVLSLLTKERDEDFDTSVQQDQPGPALEHPNAYGALHSRVEIKTMGDASLEDLIRDKLIQESDKATDAPKSLEYLTDPEQQGIAPQNHVMKKSGDFLYINVMEEIVKEKVLGIMEDNAMCMCSHCIMDSMALSLTSLPAKYIVSDGSNYFPMLNFYKLKYQLQVAAAVTSACMKVKESPHHAK